MTNINSILTKNKNITTLIHKIDLIKYVFTIIFVEHHFVEFINLLKCSFISTFNTNQV